MVSSRWFLRALFVVSGLAAGLTLLTGCQIQAVRSLSPWLPPSTLASAPSLLGRWEDRKSGSTVQVTEGTDGRFHLAWTYSGHLMPLKGTVHHVGEHLFLQTTPGDAWFGSPLEAVHAQAVFALFRMTCTPDRFQVFLPNHDSFREAWQQHWEKAEDEQALFNCRGREGGVASFLAKDPELFQDKPVFDMTRPEPASATEQTCPQGPAQTPPGDAPDSLALSQEFYRCMSLDEGQRATSFPAPEEGECEALHWQVRQGLHTGVCQPEAGDLARALGKKVQARLGLLSFQDAFRRREIILLTHLLRTLPPFESACNLEGGGTLDGPLRQLHQQLQSNLEDWVAHLTRAQKRISLVKAVVGTFLRKAGKDLPEISRVEPFCHPEMNLFGFHWFDAAGKDLSTVHLSLRVTHTPPRIEPPDPGNLGDTTSVTREIGHFSTTVFIHAQPWQHPDRVGRILEQLLDVEAMTAFRLPVPSTDCLPPDLLPEKTDIPQPLADH